jgi:hypothetical protein
VEDENGSGRGNPSRIYSEACGLTQVCGEDTDTSGREKGYYKTRSDEYRHVQDIDEKSVTMVQTSRVVKIKNRNKGEQPAKLMYNKPLAF